MMVAPSSKSKNMTTKRSRLFRRWLESKDWIAQPLKDYNEGGKSKNKHYDKGVFIFDCSERVDDELHSPVEGVTVATALADFTEFL